MRLYDCPHASKVTLKIQPVIKHTIKKKDGILV